MRHTKLTPPGWQLRHHVLLRGFALAGALLLLIPSVQCVEAATACWTPWPKPSANPARIRFMAMEMPPLLLCRPQDPAHE